MKKIFISAGIGVLLTPSFTYAATDFKGFLALITDKIINPIIPLIVGLALVAFLFGALKYITAGGDEKNRLEGIQFMTWGIVGLFVMASVWGLVNILSGTFGLEKSLPFPNL